jgi:Fe-S cluster assembly protein SufD
VVLISRRKQELAEEIVRSFSKSSEQSLHQEIAVSVGQSHVNSAIGEDGTQFIESKRWKNWIVNIKHAAMNRFLSLGVPLKGDEYWKYTDPSMLTPLLLKKKDAALALQKDDSNEFHSGCGIFEPFSDVDAFVVTFVDGHIRYDLSNLGSDDSLEIVPLGRCMECDSGDDSDNWISNLLGQMESTSQEFIQKPFAALNTFSFQDGIAIRVQGKSSKPLHIRSLGLSQEMFYSRVLILMEPESSLTVLETTGEGYRSNSVMEICLREKSNLLHIRSQMCSADSLAYSAIFADVFEDANFESFTLTAGGSVVRNELFVRILGAHSKTNIVGGGLANDGDHIDNTVFVQHKASDCSSRQVFKMVMNGCSKGVFQGKILVDQKAQRTDGYQISRALLLDEQSEFRAKPELEIYADDVKCSHGSTTSSLDAEAMFYLCSRGISESEASALLVEAFVADCVAEIADSGYEEAVFGVVREWMKRRFSLLNGKYASLPTG